jgi:hypothetical protein
VEISLLFLHLAAKSLPQKFQLLDCMVLDKASQKVPKCSVFQRGEEVIEAETLRRFVLRKFPQT